MRTRSPNLGPTRWRVLEALHRLYEAKDGRPQHRSYVAACVAGKDLRTVSIALADLGRAGYAREVTPQSWEPVGPLPPEPGNGKGVAR